MILLRRFVLFFFSIFKREKITYSCSAMTILEPGDAVEITCLACPEKCGKYRVLEVNRTTFTARRIGIIRRAWDALVFAYGPPYTGNRH